MPKIVVEIPKEVAEFMTRHHISNVNLVQAGYDILKVITGERETPYKDAVIKTIAAMHGLYDEVERIGREAELYGLKLVKE